MRLGVKRCVDVLLAVVLLFLLLPLMGAIAIAIKLQSPGPVLFRQARVGLHGKPFRIYKFRSMTVGADRSGPLSSSLDPRITSVGRFLRRTSLDELPQLVNVLVGEMSLVGPRPLLPGTIRSGEERRLEMRPGMTGLVELRRPHLLSWDQRMQVDIEYVERWRLSLDFWILLRTIPIVVFRRNTLELPRT